MDPLLKEKIGRHKKELEGSDLHHETKENLSHFIDKVAFASMGDLSPAVLSVSEDL